MARHTFGAQSTVVLEASRLKLLSHLVQASRMHRDHLTVLKRTGLVLVTVGVLDTGLMIYSIMSRTSYSSSLSIFAVMAGILLLRGSLRAASVVRSFALFFAAALVSVLVVSPLLQPSDLTLTQVRLNPGASAALALFIALTLALFFWVARELGSAPVLDAQKSSGQAPTARRTAIPVVLGMALALVVATVSVLVQRSESGKRAMLEARIKLGEGFKYHVSSMNYNSSGGVTRVSGTITAWKAETIQSVPFAWKE